MIDYAEIVERLQEDRLDYENDARDIMALLGYEVAPHRRTGFACRKAPERHWQSLPNFRSADDAELWLTGDAGYSFDDIGREEDGRWYVSCACAEFGNDIGNGKRIGTAMWAAFVRLAGEVEDEE